MTHEDHGKTQAILQVVQELDNLLLNGNTQRRRRFVADNKRRITRKRHGDKYALPLSAGKLMRIGFQGTFGIKSHELKKLLGRASTATARKLFHLRRNEH